MMVKPLQFLEDSKARFPALAGPLSKLSDLYTRRLWHQITVELQQLVDAPEVQQGDFLIQLYQNFIADFALKMNLIRLAEIVVKVAHKYPDPEAAMKFVESVIARLQEDKLAALKSEQPILMLRMVIAQTHLFGGQVSTSQRMVLEAQEYLQGRQEVEPVVAASVYQTAATLYKAKQEYANFFRAALTYLAYTDLASLPEERRRALAVDVSLAALLGEGVYGFGELVLHPIMASLDGTEFEYLRHLLTCFDQGDLHSYDQLCVKYASQLNAQPALVASERALRRKITVMSLLELVRGLPSENRAIALQTIADRAKLTVDGAEHLVMKCLADHLVEGTMDGIEGVVRVSWVQPRILTPPQVAQLRDWIGGWIGKVETMRQTLEEGATME